MEKVYSYKKISVDVVTPAGRLLVSNGLWCLEVCEQEGFPTENYNYTIDTILNLSYPLLLEALSHVL